VLLRIVKLIKKIRAVGDFVRKGGVPGNRGLEEVNSPESDRETRIVRTTATKNSGGKGWVTGTGTNPSENAREIDSIDSPEGDDHRVHAGCLYSTLTKGGRQARMVDRLSGNPKKKGGREIKREKEKDGDETKEEGG